LTEVSINDKGGVCWIVVIVVIDVKERKGRLRFCMNGGPVVRYRHIGYREIGKSCNIEVSMAQLVDHPMGMPSQHHDRATKAARTVPCVKCRVNMAYE
jgi:hypothetical protein